MVFHHETVIDANVKGYPLLNSVLGNPEFRKVLEKAPGWRPIVSNFYTSNYSLCFDSIIRLKVSEFPLTTIVITN
jgi:hypothetical protein